MVEGGLSEALSELKERIKLAKPGSLSVLIEKGDNNENPHVCQGGLYQKKEDGLEKIARISLVIPAGLKLGVYHKITAPELDDVWLERGLVGVRIFYGNMRYWFSAVPISDQNDG